MQAPRSEAQALSRLLRGEQPGSYMACLKCHTRMNALAGTQVKRMERDFLNSGYRPCSRALACSSYQRWKVKTMSVACAASLASCSQLTGI
jgi:hypothetical protein